MRTSWILVAKVLQNLRNLLPRFQLRELFLGYLRQLPSQLPFCAHHDPWAQQAPFILPVTRIKHLHVQNKLCIVIIPPSNFGTDWRSRVTITTSNVPLPMQITVLPDKWTHRSELRSLAGTRGQTRETTRLAGVVSCRMSPCRRWCLEIVCEQTKDKIGIVLHRKPTGTALDETQGTPLNHKGHRA